MKKPTEQRFWEKVNKSDDCWIWMSHIGTNGYGAFWFNGKSQSAHRVAYELAFGKRPGEFLVCHSCDNPTCVNPAHLWLGTEIDNKNDMVSKGRQGKRTGPLGRDCPVKLTRQSVLEIRSIYATGKHSQTQIGKQFGVTQQTIGQIIRREIWKHI